jgi:hypothetical protein
MQGGISSDYLPPRYLFTASLFVAGLSNILFGLSSTLYIFIPLWALNGFCQGNKTLKYSYKRCRVASSRKASHRMDSALRKRKVVEYYIISTICRRCSDCPCGQSANSILWMEIHNDYSRNHWRCLGSHRFTFFIEIL